MIPLGGENVLGINRIDYQINFVPLLYREDREIGFLTRLYESEIETALQALGRSWATRLCRQPRSLAVIGFLVYALE